LDPIAWTLKEALLACEKINGKHTGENIRDTIEQIIRQFQLEQKLFIATTDNELEEAEQDHEIISDNERIVEPAVRINQPLIISHGRK
ncbi:17697_t:CDS:2, partial [Funneliformis geosporum]